MRKSKLHASKKRFLIRVTLAILLTALVYRYWSNNNRENVELTLPELPEGFSSYGIDISHHQGEINWETLFTTSDSLIAFVYCKATEGLNHTDSQWYYNRKTLLLKGVPNGAYHFFHPKKDPKKQAQHFLDHYNSRQGDLPPVLDAEIEGTSDAQLIESMTIWLEAVEKRTGMRPIIYTSHHFFKTKFAGNFARYKFWIANYNKNVSGLEDDQIIHWQYSDRGAVPGIAGNVDMNFSKIEFD